jgi:predicted glycosyltransferase
MNESQAIHAARIGLAAAARTRSRHFRILLYSHDSFGLGHLRRNLAIAGALRQRFPDCGIVILTGSPCATQFPLPDDCDIVKIPAVAKDRTGRYVPRSLGLPLAEAISLRRQLIFAAYEAYDPDVVLVDHQPTGLLDEMMGVLERAHRDGKFVAFGMRDIVDAPAVVEGAWSSPACKRALEHCYDRVLVYGDRRVFDPLEEYRLLLPLADKIAFMGYVVEPRTHPARETPPEGRQHVLVTVGGGDDGSQRIETCLDVFRNGPAAWTSRIITGPLMPEQQVRQYKHTVKLGELRGRVKITRFHGDIPGLMHQADAILSMAGYNSCLEILQSGTPAVLMPRNVMRQEQVIRASRLAALGLVRTAPADEPELLGEVLWQALRSARNPRVELDLDGLTNICESVAQALGMTTPQGETLTAISAGSCSA